MNSHAIGSGMRSAVPVLALILFGCQPRPGSSCEGNEARCVDDATQLVCEDGQYVATPCRGPAGCKTIAYQVSCDISKNRPGDRCVKQDQGAAACLDEHLMLVCRGGKYSEAPCRGEAGCRLEGNRAVCDTSVANPSDPCPTEGTKACDPEGKNVLACRGGEMQQAVMCLGPEGCTAKVGQIDCDLSVARLGDACDAAMEGQVACNIDGKSMVACKGGKMVLEEECRKGQTCVTTGGGIACEAPR